MNYPRVCIPRVLTDEQRAEAVTIALQENEANRQEIVTPDGVMLAVQVNKLWKPGRVLRVRFMNGDDIQRMKCEREARKWEEYANIKFVFDNSPDAEIRVAFYDKQQWKDRGSWSYLGTDCGLVPKNEQTMNFGWLNNNTPDVEWQRVVLHEFGHALGADHENQQPAQAINWNKEVVYRYFMGPPNNWTRQRVDDNVLDPISSEGMAHTDFDPLSIMAYDIPPEFTTDGNGVQGGNSLSEKDKMFIGKMYPFDNLLVEPTIASLTPGAPFANGTINQQTTNNTYSMAVRQAGTYRVWSSFVEGVITIIGPDGRTVGGGLQQKTFEAIPGQYTLVVSPKVPGVTVQYRIVARKIR